MTGEKFSEYVARVMKQRGLTASDVKRNSGNKIDNSHVSKFLRGSETNPSANAMKALAAGLGVNPHDVFAAVTGYPPDQTTPSSPDVLEVLSMMEKVAMSPELMEALRELIRLSPEELASHLQLLKFSYQKERDVREVKPRKEKKG
jgi:transcriptional regulator with XRE-family HTH domain